MLTKYPHNTINLALFIIEEFTMFKRIILTVLLLIACCLSGCKKPNVESLIDKAGSGDATAQYELGIMYLEGNGVEQEVQIWGSWTTT